MASAYVAPEYWVLVSDGLMDSQPDWAGIGLTHLQAAAGGTPPAPGGMRWHKFRDAHADPDLDGRRVDLEIGSLDGRPLIMSRTPLS